MGAAVLERAERFWRGEVPGPDLVRATGAVEEIAPGVLFATEKAGGG